MALALILSSFVSILALLYLLYTGFLVHFGQVTVTSHVYCAAMTLVFYMFVHTMSIFYFIGTGKQVKEIVRENDLSPDFVAQTRRFKKIVFPAATLALFLIIITFITGGAVYVGRISWVMHLIVALFTLGASIPALVLEVKYIYRNVLLTEQVTGIGTGDTLETRPNEDRPRLSVTPHIM